MSAKQILVVTAGLMAAGAVVGAVLGAATMLGMMLVQERSMLHTAWPAIGIATGFGAAIGAVLAPVFAWGLLRTVPLGRAIGWTALGTIAGVIVGPLLNPAWLIPGALVGFTSAAVGLRISAARGTKALPRRDRDRDE